MSNSSGNNASIVWVVFVLIVVTVVIQMFAGTSSSGPAPVSTGTPEYRYARERFRQEGFSNSDADTAARAVIRFHEAQKNR